MTNINHIRTFLDSNYGKRNIKEEGFSENEINFLNQIALNYPELFTSNIKPSLDAYIKEQSEFVSELNELDTKECLYVNSIVLSDYASSNEWEIMYGIKEIDIIIHAYIRGIKVAGYGLTI